MFFKMLRMEFDKLMNKVLPESFTWLRSILISQSFREFLVVADEMSLAMVENTSAFERIVKRYPRINELPQNIPENFGSQGLVSLAFMTGWTLIESLIRDPLQEEIFSKMVEGAENQADIALAVLLNIGVSLEMYNNAPDDLTDSTAGPYILKSAWVAGPRIYSITSGYPEFQSSWEKQGGWENVVNKLFGHWKHYTSPSN